MTARLGRVVGALGVSALLATSMAVLAPAAQADSRCNTRDHTHGAAWWKRTDNYLGRSASPKYPNKTEYRHSNSDPTLC